MAKKTDDGNASLLGDPAYIGTDPIYQNSADDLQKPLEPEADESVDAASVDMRERVKENEAELKKGVNVRGSGFNVDHPKDRVNPQDQLIKDQQTVARAQAVAAEEYLAEHDAKNKGEDDDEPEGEQTPPEE